MRCGTVPLRQAQGEKAHRRLSLLCWHSVQAEQGQPPGFRNGAGGAGKSVLPAGLCRFVGMPARLGRKMPFAAMAHAACSVGQCSVLRFQPHCPAGAAHAAFGLFSALSQKGMLRDEVHRAAFLICCLVHVCRMQKPLAWPASDVIPGNRCASRGCSHWSSPRRGWCRASRPVLHRRW